MMTTGMMVTIVSSLWLGSDVPILRAAARPPGFPPPERGSGYTMCYAYNAALYCDDCAHSIMSDLDDREDYDDGDSNNYPQYCAGSDESDCPEHCDGCGEFLGNDLTSDGADYVINAYREDMESGRTDSVACTVWRDFYFWLDWPVFGECTVCGAHGELFEDDDYNECCADCLNRLDCDDCDGCEGCSGPCYPHPFTD